MTTLDALIVGAGFGGLAALKRFRDEGMDVLVVEEGSDVGGTWYWNRYPGARVDIESVEYSYPYPEVQQEWRWPEKYAAQPDVLRYFRWVAEKFDLKGHIEFETRVTRAAFNDETSDWTVTLKRHTVQTEVRTKHLVLATGFLTVPKLPDIPGIDSFKGIIAHTARWPDQEVDFEGKRVGVIGTAASGVQVIQVAAPLAQELCVFQRTANWSFPLRNAAIDDEYDAWVKSRYEAIRRVEYESAGSGTVLVGQEIVPPNTGNSADDPHAVRVENFNHRWRVGGAHLGRTYGDLMSDREANDVLRQWWTERIHELVDDPETALKLTPTHPPLARRPPGNTNYYEMFNRDNVKLVDIRSNPIARIVEHGVVLDDSTRHDLDVLVLATGFDAGGGAALSIDIVGKQGRRLEEHWKDGVRTSLGLMVHGFPNMFLINGPQSPGPFFSPPLLAVYQADLIARLFRAGGSAPAPIETTAESEDFWVDQVRTLVERTLISETDSWWIGTNVPGKPRSPVAFAGGFPMYRRFAEDALAVNLTAEASGNNAATAENVAMAK